MQDGQLQRDGSYNGYEMAIPYDKFDQNNVDQYQRIALNELHCDNPNLYPPQLTATDAVDATETCVSVD